ncbi:TPA: hypothetical protein N0F65_012125 [Lagenidium giganteum]|uniref:Uncharacterized protein n=1 Tax=Lagenidium giganteum TaxID=4803 RepID=A0AAV2YIC3_9STRA|nr:TPA: hypothetical protein N0F65_012125 [Lagenidium giganteum]
MAFCAVRSLTEEMEQLQLLRLRDPESAANVVANGKLLMQFAADGHLRALQIALDNMGESHVPLFYSARMFRVACDAQRMDILRFMLANGFDLTQTCMRDVLHSLIDGVTSNERADAIQSLIRFLIDAGVDVNWQRQDDLMTALHIACTKNLYGIAYLLILYGADVNAIAKKDEMPLTCAENVRLERALSVEETEHNDLLVQLLLDAHARRTWRRSVPPRSPASPIMKNSSPGNISSQSERVGVVRLTGSVGMSMNVGVSMSSACTGTSALASVAGLAPGGRTFDTQ